jgi:hypothetical protein
VIKAVRENDGIVRRTCTYKKGLILVTKYDTYLTYSARRPYCCGQSRSQLTDLVSFGYGFGYVWFQVRLGFTNRDSICLFSTTPLKVCLLIQMVSMHLCIVSSYLKLVGAGCQNNFYHTQRTMLVLHLFLVST